MVILFTSTVEGTPGQFLSILVINGCLTQIVIASIFMSTMEGLPGQFPLVLMIHGYFDCMVIAWIFMHTVQGLPGQVLAILVIPGFLVHGLSWIFIYLLRKGYLGISQWS